jgi:hypothetical protein
MQMRQELTSEGREMNIDAVNTHPQRLGNVFERGEPTYSALLKQDTSRSSTDRMTTMFRSPALPQPRFKLEIVGSHKMSTQAPHNQVPNRRQERSEGKDCQR